MTVYILSEGKNVFYQENNTSMFEQKYKKVVLPDVCFVVGATFTVVLFRSESPVLLPTTTTKAINNTTIDGLARSMTNFT